MRIPALEIVMVAPLASWTGLSSKRIAAIAVTEAVVGALAVVVTAAIKDVVQADSQQGASEIQHDRNRCCSARLMTSSPAIVLCVYVGKNGPGSLHSP